jgi:hypothetical protein
MRLYDRLAVAANSWQKFARGGGHASSCGAAGGKCGADALVKRLERPPGLPLGARQARTQTGADQQLSHVLL